MGSYAVAALIGALLAVIGILNMKGNISSIHYYHRRRVSEGDIVPFGRLVGLGTVIISVALLVYAACGALAERLDDGVLITVGGAALIVGLLIGLGLSFYAMIKYNKGIF